MALLIGPMMSLIARGSIGSVLTFKCGHIAAKKKNNKKLRPGEYSGQQQLFADGAEVWSNTLSFEVQQLWWACGIGEFFDLRCNPQIIALPFFSILPLALPLLAYAGPMMLNIRGYDLWMSWYLTLGPGGWPNYPSPPPFGWVPSQTRTGKTRDDEYFKLQRESN